MRRIDSRRGMYPTYRAELIATNSSLREEMFKLQKNSSNNLLNIDLNGGSSAIFTLGEREVVTSPVVSTIFANNMLKFWTKSGTYYCFSIIF